jgi:hypothetical protein
MEKEIKQDFTITWPAVYLLTTFPVVLILLGGLTCLFRDHEWHTLAFVVGYSILSFWFVRFCMRISLERAEANPRRWLLTDEGLIRVYDSGEKEPICWEQIQDMRWSKHLGLKIRWKESKSNNRPPEFRDEFRKWQTGRYEYWIRVREAEAREIFQLAKRDWFDMKL